MGESALKLLEDSSERKKTFLNDIWTPMACGLVGFGAMCFVNYGTRRPIFSGVQKHMLAATLGVVGGKTVDGWRNEHLAERDAVLRHYIQLHPEDFPDPERKKFSDLLIRWNPVR
ncbi:unnamed protein product [Diamesa serratosioi]